VNLPLLVVMSAPDSSYIGMSRHAISFSGRRRRIQDHARLRTAVWSPTEIETPSALKPISNRPRALASEDARRWHPTQREICDKHKPTVISRRFRFTLCQPVQLIAFKVPMGSLRLHFSAGVSCTHEQTCGGLPSTGSSAVHRTQQ